MLGLKSNTPEQWAEHAINDIEMFLTDHAYNEMKAAQSAMSLIHSNPQDPEFVQTMNALAIEELQHFDMVFEIIQSANYHLGKEEMNAYTLQLRKFFPKTKDQKQKFLQKLMLSSLIEARSCERFSVLAAVLEKHKMNKLADFYNGLFESEARHYSVFLNYARKFGGKSYIDEIWERLLTYEAELNNSLGTKAQVHG